MYYVVDYYIHIHFIYIVDSIVEIHASDFFW
jgi:hypothetical protein